MLNPERRGGPPTPSDFIRKNLINPTGLERLLADGTRVQALDTAASEFQTYTPEQTTHVADLLLKALAKNDKNWDENRRKGALYLLNVVPFEGRVASDKLFASYLSALGSQDIYSRPSETVLSLAKAETVLAPHFPNMVEDRIALADEWRRIESLMNSRRGWDEVVAWRHRRLNPEDEKTEEDIPKKKIHKGGKPRKDVSHVTDSDLEILPKGDKIVLQRIRDRRDGESNIDIASELGIQPVTLRHSVNRSLKRIAEYHASNSQTDTDMVEKIEDSH